MKVKFNPDDDLPLKKTLKLYNLVIAVRPVFHGGSKYYPQIFLDECLYKLQWLEYDRIVVSKTVDYCEWIICHYWIFLEISFKFQPKVCESCFNKNKNHYYYKVFLKKCLNK